MAGFVEEGVYGNGVAAGNGKGEVGEVSVSVSVVGDSEMGNEGGGAAGAVGALMKYVPSADTLKERAVEIWSHSRPWGEFMNTAQMKLNTNPAELKDRMMENYTYYFYNYLVVLLVLSILTILTSPLSILGGFFILVAYVYLFVMNPEPIEVAGMHLDNKAKGVMVIVLSLIILWITGAGATFTGLLFTMAVLSSIHAALRKGSSEVDFETAYEPVNNI
ncbi:PRA1 family protein D [Porphyridium purpureum]|uniref:PRA1 family protein n=1 Tax=Porphyridium purpureum TaxID=35688 RepID=A0A5J4YRC9_PORPP|nr:PRA1 family protein D [Porphyridium purpureum]|eukprot:POR2696..scf229_5